LKERGEGPHRKKLEEKKTKKKKGRFQCSFPRGKNGMREMGPRNGSRKKKKKKGKEGTIPLPRGEEKGNLCRRVGQGKFTLQGKKIRKGKKKKKKRGGGVAFSPTGKEKKGRGQDVRGKKKKRRVPP